MNNKILNRITHKSQQPELLKVLTERLSLSDLQSLLLEVYQKKTQLLTPKDLVTQYSQNRFVKPAQIDPHKIIKFDQYAYSLLPNDFSILELSPLCPLGTSSVIAPVSQNNTVSTIRNTEVCSDPTSVLALECASRRKILYSGNPRNIEQIKLCTSSRVLRAQTFDEPAAFSHFRILALCTAGRDKGSFIFEIESLNEQINYYLGLLTKAETIHFEVKEIRVLFVIYNLDFLNNFKNKVLTPLKSHHPKIQFAVDPDNNSGKEYYSVLRFQIFAKNTSGEEYFLIDGGFTDWTQQLLSNKKERLLTSGMGSERFTFCFGKKIMNKNFVILKWSLLAGAIYFFLVSFVHMLDLKVAGLFIYFDVPSFAYQNKIISFLCFGWSVFLFTAFLDPEKNIALIRAIMIAGIGAILGLSIVNLTTDFNALSPNMNIHTYWFETAILGLYLFWLIIFYLKIKK